MGVYSRLKRGMRAGDVSRRAERDAWKRTCEPRTENASPSKNEHDADPGLTIPNFLTLSRNRVARS
jgi:hypothetical protein